MRETSIEAYQEIKESGLLSRRRWEVYDWLYHNGPATAEKINQALSKGIGAGAWKRLSELARLGLIKDLGAVKSEQTNQTVTLWDVTENLPRGKITNESVKDSRKHLEKCKEVLKELYLHRDLPKSLREMVKQKFAAVREST